MQQHLRVAIDDTDDDDDDDDDVKQEVTDKIEKFVQTRHIQTLKYLRHVLDENRHLRLHIEHLKRRQDDPIQSPDVVDPFEPEEPSITEIQMETPEVEPIFELEHMNKATNTEEDIEAKYKELNDEIINLKKQHSINREEFQRELERVDQENIKLEKDFKLAQQQIIIVQKQNNDRQTEIENLKSKLSDEKLFNEALKFRINKVEEENKVLTDSLTQSEKNRVELETRSEELQRMLHDNEQNLANLENKYSTIRKTLQTSEQDMDSLKLKFNSASEKCHELQIDNQELRENVKFLQQQLQEKIFQEEQYNREKQSNSNFRDFVQVKRTLQICQQENDYLKIELKKLQMKLLNK